MRTSVSGVPIRPYRLSRIEYDRAVEAGAFEPDAKLELIDGDLNAMTPEGVGHTIGIDLVADSLRRVFGPGYYVRIQHPLAADDYSEPEPDVAVVRGAATTARAIPRRRCWSSRSRTNHCGTTGRSSSACTRAAGFPSTGSSPSPRRVSRSTAARLETATRASPTMQPGTRSRRSLAPAHGSPSTICFPDSESRRRRENPMGDRGDVTATSDRTSTRHRDGDRAEAPALGDRASRRGQADESDSLSDQLHALGAVSGGGWPADGSPAELSAS